MKAAGVDPNRSEKVRRGGDDRDRGAAMTDVRAAGAGVTETEDRRLAEQRDPGADAGGAVRSRPIPPPSIRPRIGACEARIPARDPWTVAACSLPRASVRAIGIRTYPGTPRDAKGRRGTSRDPKGRRGTPSHANRRQVRSSHVSHARLRGLILPCGDESAPRCGGAASSSAPAGAAGAIRSLWPKPVAKRKPGPVSKPAVNRNPRFVGPGVASRGPCPPPRKDTKLCG